MRVVLDANVLVSALISSTGEANAIVSGGQHLLDLRVHQRFPVVTPLGFLALLKLEGNPGGS